MAKGSSKSEKQLKFWQKVSKKKFEIWLFFSPKTLGICDRNNFIFAFVGKFSQKQGQMMSGISFLGNFCHFKDKINSWECFCKIGFWSVNSTNFAILGKNSPSISQSWENKKPHWWDQDWVWLDGCCWCWHQDCGWERSPNLLPTSGRNRSNLGLGSRPGVLDSPLEFSLCVSSLDRGSSTLLSLSLVKITWELHAICCCVKKIS